MGALYTADKLPDYNHLSACCHLIICNQYYTEVISASDYISTLQT